MKRVKEEMHSLNNVCMTSFIARSVTRELQPMFSCHGNHYLLHCIGRTSIKQCRDAVPCISSLTLHAQHIVVELTDSLSRIAYNIPLRCTASVHQSFTRLHMPPTHYLLQSLTSGLSARRVSNAIKRKVNELDRKQCSSVAKGNLTRLRHRAMR